MTERKRKESDPIVTTSGLAGGSGVPLSKFVEAADDFASAVAQSDAEADRNRRLDPERIYRRMNSRKPKGPRGA